MNTGKWHSGGNAGGAYISTIVNKGMAVNINQNSFEPAFRYDQTRWGAHNTSSGTQNYRWAAGHRIHRTRRSAEITELT